MAKAKKQDGYIRTGANGDKFVSVAMDPNEHLDTVLGAEQVDRVLAFNWHDVHAAAEAMKRESLGLELARLAARVGKLERRGGRGRARKERA